jgi:integrase/recombinase XerD
LKEVILMGIPKKNSQKHLLGVEIQKLHARYGEDFINTLRDYPALVGQFLKNAPVEESKKDLTIEEALTDFLGTNHVLQLSFASQKTYKSEANMFKKYCQMEFKNGLAENINVFFDSPLYLIEYLNRTENLSTRNKRSSFLRSFFKVMFKRELYNSDIILSKVLPINKDENQEPKALNMNQVKELLSLSRAGNNNFRNHALVWVLLGSGVRVSEVTQLQIGDILPESQDILIIPKKKRDQSIIKVKKKIALPAIQILVEYILFSYGHKFSEGYPYKKLYVFSKDGGKNPLTERTVQKIVKDLIDKCKLIPEDEKEKFSTHSLRHTFALTALESGVDIYRISKLLGHANVKATEVYLKLFDKQLQEAIEKHPFSDIDLDNLEEGDKK